MTAVFRNSLLRNTRLCRFRNLVFFVFMIFYSCGDKENTGIKVVWIDNKAAAVYLPAGLFKDIPADSLRKYVKVSLLTDSNSTPILGDLQVKNNIIFEPVLPFTRGSSYEVFYKNKKTGQFSIPAADAKKFPELINCYPQQDTLPENLLKIYLAFSHPMREGESEKYITIVKNNRDTIRDVFLNLQPELWNENRTVITLWLDPGRIKRDLQPNLRLGAPLKASEKYQLIVSHNWRDAQGVPLQKDFTKIFITGIRDSISPNTDHWILNKPANSSDALTIVSDEVLDHYLFEECLYINDSDGKSVKGTFEIDNDKSCRFIPTSGWVAGGYSLVIESRLEDLAGNNLNRPFDRDITQTKQSSSKDAYKLKFTLVFF